MSNIIDDMMKAIEEAIRVVTDKRNMVKIGNEVADRIRIRTRLGRGVEKTGSRAITLARLSDRYVQQRVRLRKNGQLSSFTTPKRSNLTKTDQMLSSLHAVSAKRGEFDLKFKPHRFDTHLTNKQIAEFVSDRRPFMNLSGIEIKALTDKIRLQIIDLVDQGLTKIQRR